MSDDAGVQYNFWTVQWAQQLLDATDRRGSRGCGCAQQAHVRLPFWEHVVIDDGGSYSPEGTACNEDSGFSNDVQAAVMANKTRLYEYNTLISM